MSRLAMIAAAVATIACADAAAPAFERDPRCEYPGDTIAVIRAHDAHGRVLQCHYLIAREKYCYAHPIRLPDTSCPIGTRRDA